MAAQLLSQQQMARTGASFRIDLKTMAIERVGTDQRYATGKTLHGVANERSVSAGAIQVLEKLAEQD
jgi:hypothetical protein